MKQVGCNHENRGNLSFIGGCKYLTDKQTDLFGYPEIPSNDESIHYQRLKILNITKERIDWLCEKTIDGTEQSKLDLSENLEN